MKLYLTDVEKDKLLSGPESQAGKLELTGLVPIVTRVKQITDPENVDRAMITTESEDRDDDIVIAEGGQLGNYRRNPVVLFAHTYNQAKAVMGRSIEEIIHPGVGIEAAWEWAEKINPEAALVKNLWREKFLNAISIGFAPMDWERREYPKDDEPIWPGFIFNTWELLEYSVAIVPANQDALRLVYNSIGATIELGDRGDEGLKITQPGQANQLLTVPDSTEANLTSDDATDQPNKDATIENIIDDPEVIKVLRSLQPLIAEVLAQSGENTNEKES